VTSSHWRFGITLAFLGFACILPATVGAQAPTYLTQWGSVGTSNGQLAFGIFTGVATDAACNVYITDAYNNYIQKFTGTGAYLTQRGSSGGGNGQFGSPNGVATDDAGNVYVAAARCRENEAAPPSLPTCLRHRPPGSLV